MSEFHEAAEEFIASRYGQFLLQVSERKMAIRAAWKRGANWELFRRKPDMPCKAAAPGWLKGKP